MSLKIQILVLLFTLTFIESSNIPRNSLCLIRNRLFPESGYLYPESEKYNTFDTRRNIFTEIFNPISGYAPWCLISNDHCKWKFEVQADRPNSYKLKSSFYEEYLYSAAEDLKRDKDRRQSFTWMEQACNDLECFWSVEQVPGEDYYTIKNEKYLDHLYAAIDDFNYDAKRRSVFGWKWNGNAGVNNDKASHWSIIC